MLERLSELEKKTALAEQRSAAAERRFEVNEKALAVARDENKKLLGVNTTLTNENAEVPSIISFFFRPSHYLFSCAIEGAERRRRRSLERDCASQGQAEAGGRRRSRRPGDGLVSAISTETSTAYLWTCDRAHHLQRPQPLQLSAHEANNVSQVRLPESLFRRTMYELEV